jgi:hypothetical protein
MANPGSNPRGSGFGSRPIQDINGSIGSQILTGAAMTEALLKIQRGATDSAQVTATTSGSYQPLDPRMLAQAVQAGVEAALADQKKSTTGAFNLGNAPSSSGQIGTYSTIPGLPFSGSSQSGGNPGGYGEGLVNSGGLRNNVTSQIGQKVSEFGRKTFAPQIQTTQNGNSTQYHAMNQDGTWSPISQSQAQSYQNRGQALNSIKSTLGGLAGAGEEGGLAGMAKSAGSGAMEALGVADLIPGVDVAAAAATAVMAGVHVAADERSKNTQYQSVLGGSNASGFGQRFSEEGFRLSHLGDLSGQQAQQIFQGTTALGMTGGNRQEATSTATDLYNSLGVSISQSLQLITTAAMSGNKELINLANGIKSVSTAAASSGINANDARQMYNSSYQAVVAGGVSGTQAPLAAQAQTNAMTTMGNQYSGISLSPLSTSMTSQYMQANSLGMSQSQYLGTINSPGGSLIQGKAQENMLWEAISNFCGSSMPALQQMVGKALQQAKANGQSIQDMYPILGNQALKLGLIGGYQGFQAAMQAYGVATGYTESTYAGFIIGVIAGKLDTSVGINPAAQAQKAVTASQTSAAIKGSNATAATASVNLLQLNGGFNSLNYTAAQKKQITADYASIGASVGGTLSTPQRTYIQNVTDKNKQDPILAALVKNPMTRNALYQVQVNGKRITVSAEDLIKHFSDQVQAGTAEVMSGENSGENVLEATGMAASGKQRVTSDKMSKANLDKIQTYNKKQIAAANVHSNKNDGGAVTGTIKLVPTDALNKWLTYMTTGNLTQQTLAPNPGNYPNGG